MKKFLAILLMTIFFIGCGNTGKIIVRHDSFTNKTVVSLKLSGNSEEYRYGYFTYVREISKTKIVPTKLRFNLHMREDDADLTGNVFVRIDDQQYEMAVENRGSRYNSRTSTSSTSSSSTESSTTSSSGSSTTVETEVETTTWKWKELTGTLRFNKEMEEKLAAAQTMTLRFYAAEQPATYIISKGDLEKMKKFLKAGQESQK